MNATTLKVVVDVECVRCHHEAAVPHSVLKTREWVGARHGGIPMGDTEIARVGPCADCGADTFDALMEFVMRDAADRLTEE